MKSSRGFKLIALLIIMIFISVVAIALAEFIRVDENSGSSIKVYFTNSEKHQLIPESATLTGENNDELLHSAITSLSGTPKSDIVISAVPDSIKFVSEHIDGKTAVIDISEEYYNLSPIDELIFRGSVVWTLTELSFIEHVRITVNGRDIIKNNGETIGLMDRDNLVINGQLSPVSSNYMTFSLYFPKDDATGLAAEERSVEAYPNERERKVLEELIMGPTQEGLISSIPEETKVISVETVDGVCYVNLSREFVTEHKGGSSGELLTVYSVVNSLTSLDTVDKVQFLIDGEKSGEFQGHLDFSVPFEFMQF